jgi:DNA-binding response OmpR family regulator
MAHVVVVEDDAGLGSRLVATLCALGHDADWCADAAAALERTDRETADLVLIDLGLPDADGFELCGELRRRLPGAVLVVLTARTEEMDVIQALESGADDYLMKPFRLAELQARIRAHLRRGPSTGSADGAVVRHGGVVIDRSARRCLTPSGEVELRPREFDLLVRLAAAAGEAVSREALMSDVWDENWFGSTKTLDVHVAALRRKLGDRVRITTLRTFGYRLEAPAEG